MNNIRDVQERTLLVVATSNWRKRLADGLGKKVEDILWFDNVYEAWAEALKLSRQGENVLAVILIDSLTGEEMHIFGCLKGLDQAVAVAVSTAGNRIKTNQAKMQGAWKVVHLRDLPQLFKQSDRKEPGKAHIEQKTVEIAMVDEILSESQQEVKPSELESASPIEPADKNHHRLRVHPKPHRTPPRRTTEAKEPTLSQAELDALLG